MKRKKAFQKIGVQKSSTRGKNKMDTRNKFVTIRFKQNCKYGVEKIITVTDFLSTFFCFIIAQKNQQGKYHVCYFFPLLKMKIFHSCILFKYATKFSNI